MKTREQTDAKTMPCPAVLFAAAWALVAWATALTGAGLGEARAAGNPYCGSWALTLPGGWPAWLGVEQDQGQLNASLVWMDGTFGPLAEARLEDRKLVMTRRLSGRDLLESITATVEGDTLKLVKVTPRQDDQGEIKLPFTGRRLPPMPPAPDLSKVKFGDPIELFNGRDLSGWRISNAQAEVFNAQAGRLTDLSGQTLDITLVDRHVTVILNGTKIINNEPVLGCTPWALWADVTRPGPIYLRGDNTNIEYRNLILRPVRK